MHLDLSNKSTCACNMCTWIFVCAYVYLCIYACVYAVYMHVCVNGRRHVCKQESSNFCVSIWIYSKERILFLFFPLQQRSSQKSNGYDVQCPIRCVGRRPAHMSEGLFSGSKQHSAASWILCSLRDVACKWFSALFTSQRQKAPQEFETGASAKRVHLFRKAVDSSHCCSYHSVRLCAILPCMRRFLEKVLV